MMLVKSRERRGINTRQALTKNAEAQGDSAVETSSGPDSGRSGWRRFKLVGEVRVPRPEFLAGPLRDPGRVRHCTRPRLPNRQGSATHRGLGPEAVTYMKTPFRATISLHQLSVFRQPWQPCPSDKRRRAVGHCLFRKRILLQAPYPRPTSLPHQVQGGGPVPRRHRHGRVASCTQVPHPGPGAQGRQTLCPDDAKDCRVGLLCL